jgi:hypothetical protein
LATVLRLVDCNVTHDVTLFCVESPSTRNIRRQHVKSVLNTHKVPEARKFLEQYLCSFGQFSNAKGSHNLN